jgi:pimeloyl-ACP methyl ester carboxylesterase
MSTHVVDTARGPVEYTEAGSGPPILYFHGTGVTGDVMLSVESPLVDAGFRLIVPNRPGYGRTPLGQHHSAADCANLAAALLDLLGISEVAVMGSSGGAAFATSFAIRHSDRTHALVLLCPQLHRWDDKRWLPKASRWTLPFLTRRRLRSLLLGAYRFQLRRMTAAQFLKMEAGERYVDVANDPALQTLSKATLTAMHHAVHSPGFDNDFAVFTREEIIGTGDVLQPPTLVLHDALDPIAPVEHVDWFVAHFPQCRRVTLHVAGHLVWAGPDARLMHETRVRFLREHVSAVKQPQ